MHSQPHAEQSQQLKDLPFDQPLKLLGTSENGLTQNEADARLARYGPNDIPKEEINPILKFLSYFWGPIPWMIETANGFAQVFSQHNFHIVDVLH